MGEASSSAALKTSRSGRVIIPRLKCWTGERVVLGKSGDVKILGGNPDCTSTFKTERSLFREYASCCLSQSLQISKVKSYAKAPRASSEPRAVEVKQKSAKLKSKYPEKNDKPSTETVISPIRRSPRKSPRKQTSDAILPNRRTEQQSPTRRRNAKGRLTGAIQLSDASAIKSPVSADNTPTKIRRRKHGEEPNEEQRSTSVSPSKICAREPEKTGLVPTSLDIYGPAFQPYVLVRRLRIEEFIKQTETSHVNDTRCEIPSQPLGHKRKIAPGPKRSKSSRRCPEAAAETLVLASTSHVYRPRTIKDTRKLLCVLNEKKAKSLEKDEDEATSTAAFFQKSRRKTALKQLMKAEDILNEDFGESDDNLSIRALSERESSPMSSAVSPIGSLHETDGDDSDVEEGLLSGSPSLRDPTSFQAARLVHRVMKDKAKLAKANRKLLRKETQARDPSAACKTTPVSSNLLNPRGIRALEKDLKKKAKGSNSFDFAAYYNGNLLHVSVNSDSEDSESSTDSFSDI